MDIQSNPDIQARLIPHPELDRLALIDDLDANARETGNYAEAGLLDRHNPPVGEWLLHALLDAVREYTGEEVYPRNCYGRIVTHGAELIEHTDRDDIDWVVSVNVMRDAPSYLEVEIDGTWHAFNDAHGAVLNRGNRWPHRRLPYTGQRAYQLILNYTRTKPAPVEEPPEHTAPAGNFVIVKNVLGEADIARIRAEAGEELARGELGGGRTDDSTRVSDVAWLEPGDQRWTWLRRILCGVAMEANAERWQLDVRASMQFGIQYTHYGPGDFYAWHRDIATDADDPAATRTLSMSVVLQHPEAGGGLELRNGGVIPLDVGDAVVFPADEEHRALEVTRGERIALVAWFRRGFKPLRLCGNGNGE